MDSSGKLTNRDATEMKPKKKKMGKKEQLGCYFYTHLRISETLTFPTQTNTQKRKPCF